MYSKRFLGTLVVEVIVTVQVFFLFILFCLCSLLPLPVAGSEPTFEAPPQFAWKIPAMQGHFSFPHGVAVDGNGNIYVADSENNRAPKFSRIQKFSPGGGLLAIGGYPLRSSW